VSVRAQATNYNPKQVKKEKRRVDLLYVAENVLLATREYKNKGEARS
jgi:hypothetical protein